MKSDCMHTYINSLYIYLLYLICSYGPGSFPEDYEHQVQGHPGLNGSLMVNYGFYNSCPEHPGNDGHKTQAQFEQVSKDTIDCFHKTLLDACANSL